MRRGRGREGVAGEEEDVPKVKKFGGKILARVGPEIHEELASLAAASDTSVNQELVKAVKFYLKMARAALRQAKQKRPSFGSVE